MKVSVILVCCLVKAANSGEIMRVMRGTIHNICQVIVTKEENT